MVGDDSVGKTKQVGDGGTCFDIGHGALRTCGMHGDDADRSSSIFDRTLRR